MKTRNLSILLSWMAAAAFGANAPSDKDRIVMLAVDFCGGLVGEAPEAARAGRARIPELNLSDAKPLREWTSDEKARSGIGSGLDIKPDDPMRLAAIGAPPSLDSKISAMFTVDGIACSASGATGEDAFSAIVDRLDADKRWRSTERTATPRTATWRRTSDAGGELVFMLFNEGTLTFNRVIAKFPPTTPESIRPLVQSVAEQCVSGVLNGSDMNVDAFTQFYPYRRADSEGHVAGMRTFSAFPFAFLNAGSFRKEFDCELSFGTRDTPADKLRGAMVEVIGGLGGVVKKSDSEWRIHQPGKKHTAQVTTEIDARGLVLLRIRTLGGHG